MSHQLDIPVLSTGGTFEKVYGSGSGVREFSFPKESAVERIVRIVGMDGDFAHSRTRMSVAYSAGLAKDSLDMTAKDRDWIADWCNRQGGGGCIVIHGTDTMIETAGVIAKKCKGKTVILTGALQPASMRDTDAEFNLGGAVIAARLCKAGVYIVMSGQIFNWNKCQKDSLTGHFEALDE